MCISLSWVIIQQILNLYVNMSGQFIWAVVKPEEVILSPLSPCPPPLLPPPGCCGPVPSLIAAFAVGGPFIGSIELSNCRKAWIWGEGKGARFGFCGFSKLRQLDKTSEKQQRWDEGCEGSVWPRRRRGRKSSLVEEQEQWPTGLLKHAQSPCLVWCFTFIKHFCKL